MADKDKLDLVHQDAIHTERVQKEQRHQKLHTEFSINPYRKLHILPDKPMCRRPTEVIPEHADFIKAFHKAHEVPTKKYSVPLTESQEIGWVSTPLVPEARCDTRYNFFRFMTDVTKHQEFAQQTKN
ncbi:cilia- and flagella-associated protein 144 [Archocentrus centrarchus]|uniref:cilia- and flagella-associated protein 144 n=1 Tax=Archocentrus centrarchus TaxID=63155 RepID=UPI0011E9E629|nr:protein FAM183A [Archocentrus centrarchus]